MPVAVITGGSSGIGAATARRSPRGAGAACSSPAGRAARAVAAEIGGEAEVCDVSDRASVDDAAARVAERHEAIGLLVLNAGIPGGGGFLELPPERIELVTGVNFLGSVWGLRAFLPCWKRAHRPTWSWSRRSREPRCRSPSGPYAASKHAQLAFARSVGDELAPRGIRMHARQSRPGSDGRVPAGQGAREPLRAASGGHARRGRDHDPARGGKEPARGGHATRLPARGGGAGNRPGDARPVSPRGCASPAGADVSLAAVRGKLRFLMRLRRADLNGPGIVRRRRGRGWEYLDEDGGADRRPRKRRPDPRAGDPAGLEGRLDLPRTRTATSRPSERTPPGASSTATTSAGASAATRSSSRR